jgi:hypothetical protein
MPNNLSVSHGFDAEVRTTETDGVHTPHQNAHLFVGETAVSTEYPIPVTVVDGTTGGGSSSVDPNVALLLSDIKQLIAERGTADDDLTDCERSEWDAIRSRINRAIGSDGKIANSDAPVMLSGVAGIVNGVLLTVDTTGYNSVGIQLYGTWAGTVAFVASNDGVTWYPIAGMPAASAQAPVTTSTTNGLWLFPAIGKWFRAYVSAYTSGTSFCVAFLRTQPLPLASTPSVNTAQIAGTATVVAGVAGLQAVGGNVAVGVVPTSNPIPIGVVDTNGKTQRLLVLPSGSIFVTDPLGQESRTVESLQGILLSLQQITRLLMLLPEAMNKGMDMPDINALIQDKLELN